MTTKICHNDLCYWVVLGSKWASKLKTLNKADESVARCIKCATCRGWNLRVAGTGLVK